MCKVQITKEWVASTACTARPGRLGVVHPIKVLHAAVERVGAADLDLLRLVTAFGALATRKRLGAQATTLKKKGEAREM
jgi:hypothetical protein